MKKIIQIILLILFCAIVLAVSLRGILGNPTSSVINQPQWRDNGPFELSPERGRYALTYSFLEDKTFHFELPIARFATPDVGYKDGKYVSLFAPGVSFLIMPGYLVGKYFGSAQVGAYAVVSVFALINVLLLRSLAIRLGASPISATIGGMVFLFATPAYSYAVSLYQHHISTFLILLSLYILSRWNSLFSLTLIWLLCAASIPVDYPNLFLMFPIGIVALGRIIYAGKSERKVTVSVKLLGFLTFIGAIFPLLFFLWFNSVSYNNPFQLSGTVTGARIIDENGKPQAPAKDVTKKDTAFNPDEKKKTAIAFFQTRNLANGMATHLFNRDRGILWYSPIIFLSIVGAFFLYRTNRKMLAVLVGVIGANFVLYSLWGDPYGGWGFGSRYLIPTYAISGILLAIALTKWGRKISFVALFTLLFVYSVSINTLGAITSSRNPPKAEVLGLEKLSGREEKYSFDRNFQFLETTGSKSFVYQTFAYKFVDAKLFYLMLVGALGGVGTALIVMNTLGKKEVTQW